MEQIIDMVIPYVDNNDNVWQKLYINYCTKYGLQERIIDMQTCRYKDNLRLIDYQLKLINKNMPWVRTIFLLLSNYEQQPKDLPNNVKIVYHPNFIPREYLPTFNSCTIEMFLWNIKNLSEYFIYANDDMLPIRPMKPNDFFENGKIKIEWWKEDIREQRNMFRLQCLNSYNHTCIRLRKPCNNYEFIRPAHSFTPMIKSHCKESFMLLNDIIKKHIRAFRTEYQYNQYIYPIYEKLKYGTLQSELDFLYTQCKEDFDYKHDIICFNIIPKDKAKEIKERLEELCIK